MKRINSQPSWRLVLKLTTPSCFGHKHVKSIRKDNGGIAPIKKVSESFLVIKLKKQFQSIVLKDKHGSATPWLEGPYFPKNQNLKVTTMQGVDKLLLKLKLHNRFAYFVQDILLKMLLDNIRLYFIVIRSSHAKCGKWNNIRLYQFTVSNFR